MRTLFIKGLIGIALALLVLALLLQLGRLSHPSWWEFVAVFGIGVLILHKRAVPVASEASPSALRSFFKVFLLYFVPASLLWFLLILDFFTRYLPRIGIAPSPLWVTVSVAAGLTLLAQGLLGPEFSELAAQGRGAPPKRNQ